MSAFFEILAEARKFGVSDLLEKWENPQKKPTPLVLINDDRKIRLISYVSSQYFSKISSGCVVTLQNLLPDQNKIQVHCHEFGLNDYQLTALKTDNFGYIFDIQGFTYFYSKEEYCKAENYKKELSKFNDFEKDLKETQLKIKKEIDYLNAVKQHKELNNLPFSYYVAIKVNVRMLTGKNWGDGAKKNTVTHLVLLEDYQGTIKRSKDSFLCGAKASSYGSPNIKDDALKQSSIWGQEKALIDCPKCIDFAYKILNKC